MLPMPECSWYCCRHCLPCWFHWLVVSPQQTELWPNSHRVQVNATRVVWWHLSSEQQGLMGNWGLGVSAEKPQALWGLWLQPPWRALIAIGRISRVGVGVERTSELYSSTVL